jgi:hypothetical protein
MIVTDSLSSIQAIQSRKISYHTHPGIHECKQKLFDLKNTGRVVTLMWVPSHVGIAGNEKADLEARRGALSTDESGSQPIACDHFPLTKTLMKEKWQSDWDSKDTGRFTHSIFPIVRLKAWFEGYNMDRNTITTISRMMSGHCGVKAHLRRFGIVDSDICVCLEDYETIDHIIWYCPRLKQQSSRLKANLLSEGIVEETTVRDLSGQSKWKALRECVAFLRECDIKV